MDRHAHLPTRLAALALTLLLILTAPGALAACNCDKASAQTPCDCARCVLCKGFMCVCYGDARCTCGVCRAASRRCACGDMKSMIPADDAAAWGDNMEMNMRLCAVFCPQTTRLYAGLAGFRLYGVALAKDGLRRYLSIMGSGNIHMDKAPLTDVVADEARLLFVDRIALVNGKYFNYVATDSVSGDTTMRRAGTQSGAASNLVIYPAAEVVAMYATNALRAVELADFSDYPVIAGDWDEGAQTLTIRLPNGASRATGARTGKTVITGGGAQAHSVITLYGGDNEVTLTGRAVVTLGRNVQSARITIEQGDGSVINLTNTKSGAENTVSISGNQCVLFGGKGTHDTLSVNGNNTIIVAEQSARADIALQGDGCIVVTGGGADVIRLTGGGGFVLSGGGDDAVTLLGSAAACLVDTGGGVNTVDISVAQDSADAVFYLNTPDILLGQQPGHSVTRRDR